MKAASTRAPKKIAKGTSKKSANKLVKKASMKTTTSSTLSESEMSYEPVKQFFFARHGLSHFN